jgi:hypothetical protein
MPHTRITVIVVAALAAATWECALPGLARADAVIDLADGHIERPGVSITSTGERAVVSPSMAANGIARTAWVTGDVSTTVDTPDGIVGPNLGAQQVPGTQGVGTHGASALTVGYIMGCQVSLSDLTVNGAAGLFSTVPYGGGNGSIPLAPGQVKYIRVQTKDMPTSGTYAIDYQDFNLEVPNCAGYAQARQFTTVEIIGTDYSKTTLYGQPFSLG